LADSEARQARERTGRRLEDEAHRARFALRCELIRQRMEAHRVLAADTEAVLEERAARVVVLEELHETALLRAHHLVDRLRVLVRRFPDLHLAGLFGAPQGLVLVLRPVRERVDEVRWRGVAVPVHALAPV